MKKALLVLIGLINFILTHSQNAQFNWVKQIKGDVNTGNVTVNGTGQDAENNIYVFGFFRGNLDFDPSHNIYELTSISSRDIYISKFDKNGILKWVKQIPVNTPGVIGGQENLMSIDKTGNVIFVCALFGTVDFDPGAGVYDLSAANGGTVICKLDSSGNFVWAKQLQLNIKSIATTAGSLNILLGGSFNGSKDFDPSTETHILTSLGDHDVYILNLTSNGELFWVKQIGGAQARVFGMSMNLDSASNVYYAGSMYGTVDFDPGNSLHNITSYSNAQYAGDLFVSKLDAAGNFIWARHMGRDSLGVSEVSVVVSELGDAYISGLFTSHVQNGPTTVDVDPGVNVVNLSLLSNERFILKLNKNGNYLWHKNADYGVGLAVDKTGNLYTGGSTFQNGWGHIARYNSNGNLIWNKRLIGLFSESLASISNVMVDRLGNVFTAGYFTWVVDFDPGTASHFLSTATVTSEDIFIHKMTQGPVGNGGGRRTSVTPLMDNLTINVYPNPVSDYVNLNFSEPLTNASILVYNQSGQLVAGWNNINDVLITIDISGFANGIYFINVLNGETVINKQFIKN